jgi:hypothetical protein
MQEAPAQRGNAPEKLRPEESLLPVTFRRSPGPDIGLRFFFTFPLTMSQLRPDGVAAAGVELLPPDEALRPASPRPRPAQVEPLAPGRHKVQFTASAALHDKLERLQALMRSSVPDGDLVAIVEQAVTEKLQRLEARRFALTQAPRKTLAQSETSPTTRQIPAAVNGDRAELRLLPMSCRSWPMRCRFFSWAAASRRTAADPMTTARRQPRAAGSGGSGGLPRGSAGERVGPAWDPGPPRIR